MHILFFFWHGLHGLTLFFVNGKHLFIREIRVIRA